MQGKRYLIPVFALLFLIGVPGSGYCGVFESGNDLVNYMREHEKVQSGGNPDWYQVGILYGFVLGVHDALWTLGRFKTPASITKGQLVSVVSKFLKENPNRWHEPGVNLVIDALKEAFPKEQ